MNFIRKRTYQTPREKREQLGTRPPTANVLLLLGVMAIPIGAILGIIEYDIYINGRPEHLVSTNEGTMYKSEVPPGEPRRKASAIAGFCIAGSGIFLIYFSAIVYEISAGKKSTKKEDFTQDSPSRP